MKKRFLTIALAFIWAFSLIPIGAVHAAQAISVTINGKEVNFDGQPPVVVDGRTLVPVRGVFETLGFTVDWNNNTRQATLTKGSDIIVITLNSATFTVNGASHTLDVPAQNIGGRTLVPLRAVLESVGYEMDWDGNTSTVVIGSGAAETVAATTPATETSVNPEQILTAEELAILAQWGSYAEGYASFLAKLRSEGNNVIFLVDHNKMVLGASGISNEFHQRVGAIPMGEEYEAGLFEYEARLSGIEVGAVVTLNHQILIPEAIRVAFPTDRPDALEPNTWFLERLESEGLFTGPKTYYYVFGMDGTGGLYIQIGIEGAPTGEQVRKFLENVSDEEIAELVEQYGYPNLG